MLLACEAVSRGGSTCLVDATGHELAFDDLAGRPAEVGLVAAMDALICAHGRPAALAVAAGPGSFTGLRVAVTLIRTLAWVDALSVYPVDSLWARAREAGDGCWLVLVPLKRDTTFHALIEVVDGRCTALSATAATLDAAPPSWPAAVAAAVAIGPALTAKPGLAERWAPGIRLGSPAGLTARGVAAVAQQFPAVRWNDLLPQYHQRSAPELQRDRT